MAQKLTGGFPPDLDLPANFVVQLNAVDPTTGAAVSGVKISNVAILALPSTPGTADETGGFPPATPLWLPVSVDG